MEPLFHTIPVVSAAVVSGLFSAVWQGAVLVACAALCLRLLPGLSAAARSAVWMLLFLMILLLHVLPVRIGEHRAALGPVHGTPLHLDLRWSVAIAGLWAALSLWKGVQLALAAVHLRRLAGRATPVQPDAATQALLQGGNGGRSAELCTSAEVERPSVFGFIRPRILLPPGLVERLSAQELQQVVLHEMEHLRRADDWTNLLQKVGLVLFPLNPVLLWVERQLCAERELACDDRVLHSHCGRKAYAVCLTRLAEYSMLHRGVSLVLGAWDKRPELVRRVHRILRRPEESMSGRRGVMVTAGLVAGLLGGAVALVHSPQLLSFVPPAQTPVQTTVQTAEDAMEQATAQAHLMRTAAVREIRTRATEVPATEVSATAGPAKDSPVKLVRLATTGQPRTQVQSSHRPRQPRALAVKQDMSRPHGSSHAGWVVLSEWRSDETAGRMVIAVAQDHRTSYAAVPFADGWLIVQI